MLSYEETRNLCFVFKTNPHLISEKVTYVHQDRENQSQPFFSENTLPFFSKRITFFSSLAVTIFSLKGFFLLKTAKMSFFSST